MKNIFTLLGLFIFILCSAQPGTPDANGVITAGPPWVTGVQQGDGELKLQFTYLNAAILLNDAEIAVIEDSITDISARSISNSDHTNLSNIGDLGHPDIDSMMRDSIGWFIVDHPGDSTSAEVEIQSAIDKANDAGGGKVYLRNGRYITNDTLTMYSNVIVEGQSQEETKLYGNTLMFHFPSGGTFRWALRYLNIRQMSEPCIQMDVSNTDWEIEHCRFNKQDDDDALIITGDDYSTLVEGRIYDCDFDMNVSSTTPFIKWSSDGSVNSNTIDQCRFQADYATGCYMIEILDSSGNNAYNNHLIDLVFETCLGGAFKGNSVRGTHIDNCWVYDITGRTTTDHLFNFDRLDAGDLVTSNTTMINSGRVGGTTLGGGLYDVYMTNDAKLSILINCYGNNPNLAVSSGSSTNNIYGGSIDLTGSIGIHLKYGQSSFFRGVNLQPAATPPSGAVAGGIYSDTDGWLYHYDSSWDQIATTNKPINSAADAQGDDDYEIALPHISTLYTFLTVTFTATTANTDGATLEITSVGDVDAILKNSDAALITGDIKAGQIVQCVWDGSNWQMTSQLAQ